MELTVNGVTRAISSPPLTSLLQVLREELDVLSPKAGCQQGGCGACTVLLDGEPRRGCLVPVAAAEGHEITTVEGLGTPGDLSPIQAAFHQKYAAQCGYCTAGMLMASHALINRNGGREVQREQVIEALSGHICRCTGYVKIVDAVIAASRGDVDVEKEQGLLVAEPSEPAVEPKGAPA
ncbi:MAG: (2Fe-2S)-binding protein [Solirubrobacterales bacterium]|nr:(2Fe-2S)-binding protein [Solirubrobacterales bacterium]MBV9713845.1 (2Fe-2S)-binding protein [Solirubrobacterales bacterium]